MNTFFLVVELVFLFGLSIYQLFQKNELAIIYLPVALFVIQIIVPTISPIFYYATVSLIILWATRKNGLFFRANVYALLLFIYFIILMPKSTNLESARSLVFSSLWLFVLIPLISTIYRKYPREVVLKEITNTAIIILCLFIANSVMSTLKNYSPKEMYHITSGILYGNLLEASLNVLAIALFILLLKIINDKKLFYISIYLVSFLFVMLTLRRSVMGVSIAGIGIAALTLQSREKAKMLFIFGAIIILIGTVVYYKSDFVSQFNERVELRKLDERKLTEEGRFLEYELLYKDMFVYNEYSPWFGFELFNSWGNYGKGIFGERSLHGDLPNIAHSSGIIGVILYLLMVYTAFLRSIRSAVSSTDKIIILFCGLTFIVYTLTGRYTELSSTLLLFLLLMLPLTNDNSMEVINEDRGSK